MPWPRLILMARLVFLASHTHISKLIKPDFLSLLLGPLLPSYGEGLAGLRWLGVVNLMYFAQTVLRQCRPDHVFRVRNEGALQARRAGSDFG